MEAKIVEKIVKFVKNEPKTVQEISKLIKKSWVTADSYTKKIKEQTGLINIKVFRKNTPGAVKVVYYNYSEALISDDIKEDLFNQIKTSRKKEEFDFLEVFQYIPDKNKKSFSDKLNAKTYKMGEALRRAENVVYIFSGNLSFINKIEDDKKMSQILEELLKRKVMIKILCRINIASLSNIEKMIPLLTKYPEFIEIKHHYQPLRGYIVDESFARFNTQELKEMYQEKELPQDIRLYYEIYDKEWLEWLIIVFWKLYKTSNDYYNRFKQINELRIS